tara:strand:+ start:1323 stop:2168 length:846 start_codon:yes stop_codon:yes gene_type:complete
MNYLTGYTIKPYEITSLGEVVFTDGTNNAIQPNQSQCEAYGYTYDRASGTCSAFRFNTNLDRTLSNINNKNNGSGNTNQLGANTIQVNGTLNTTRGFNNNCFINGSSNEIANGVNNATVFGLKGEATATNSIVLGGNAAIDVLGTRQSITLMYGTLTDDNTLTNSYLNNTADSFFTIPEQTLVSFRSETVAVRIGGSAGAGAVGDFKAWVERGVAIKRSGSDLIIDSGRDVIANTGTTAGWVPAVAGDGNNFLQTVKGANNRDIMWATTITFTQINTGVDL